MKKILIVNGPNLNLLGSREKTIYGEKSFEEYFEYLITKFPNFTLSFFQSNDEKELVEKIQEAGSSFDGIVLNPAAYGHTSLALADAVSSISIPCIEVHISNIYARENFRHYTLISKNCAGTISGFGLNSYLLALNFFNQTS